MSNYFGTISLGELTFFTSRAAFAAGCSYGVAEDVATVAVWLAKNGVDPTEVLSKAFDNIASGNAASLMVKTEDGSHIHINSHTGDRSSAIFAGIAASDQLAASNATPEINITLNDIDFPELAAAFIYALYAKNTVVQMQLLYPESAKEISDFTECDFEEYHTCKLQITTNNLVEISPGKEPAINNHYNITVSNDGWNGILKHFRNSLVKATDASRLCGAGAGLIDTD